MEVCRSQAYCCCCLLVRAVRCAWSLTSCLPAGCTHDLAFWVAWTGLLWAPWLAVVWSLVFVHGPIGLIDELGRSASRKRMAALFAVLWALGLVWAITGAVWVFRDNKPRDPACPTNLYWGAYAGSAALLAETLLPLVFYPVAACVIVRGTWHRN